MVKYSIEQINVSDDAYVLTDIRFKNGVAVKKGDIIFSYESSKADFDVEAISDGYIYFNNNNKIKDSYKVGYTVAVVLTEITTNPNIFFTESESYQETETGSAIETEKKITKKAQKLIDQHKINVNKLEGDLITEETVNIYLKQTAKSVTFQDIDFYYQDDSLKGFTINTAKRLAIIGAGKAALQLMDAIIASRMHIPVVFYDTNTAIIGKTLLGIPIYTLEIGKLKEDFENKVFDEIIVSFSGNITERKNWFIKLIDLGLPIANVIHPTCHISNFVHIGRGNIFFAFTRIGPFVEVGDNNVVSSYCSFEHHNKIGNHNTFGPSVIFSGSSTMGDEIKFGTGIFIEPKIAIGNNSIISSGSIVQKNIPPNSILRNLNKNEIKSRD